ncbi:Hypothetical protein PHPALM_168 [Phytophthora palmivora]|uniref:Uncharacterized protein n=1 Tax=Phytophthora palmivora TaxID=4796 RepID=A0A2P4YVJ2_9STRA|nr:Hypothetical protein PHPALM_168 [Phytophthora palmivora]
MVRTSFCFDDDKELVQLARGYEQAGSRTPPLSPTSAERVVVAIFDDVPHQMILGYDGDSIHVDVPCSWKAKPQSVYIYKSKQNEWAPSFPY